MSSENRRRHIAPRHQLYDTRNVRKNRGGSAAGLFANIFNPSYSVQTFQGYGSDGEVSIFRPLPPLDPFEPETKLYPGRISDDPGHFSHWQQPYILAKWIGIKSDDCRKTTLVLGQPGDGQWHLRPYSILHRAVSYVKRGKIPSGMNRRFDVQWLRLLDNTPQQAAELSAPTETFLIQCAVYQGAVYDQDKKKNVLIDFIARDGEPFGLKERDPLTIFVLTRGTGYKLISGHEGSAKRDPIDALLDTKDPENPGRFYFGDPVGQYHPNTNTVTGGVFVHVFMPSKGQAMPKELTTWDGKISEFQPYEACVTKVLSHKGKTIRPDLTSQQVDQVFEKFQFWEDSSPGANDGLIRVISLQEEAALVASAFKTLPRLLEYGWIGHPEFFTDEVKAILRSRTSVVIAGNVDEDENGEEEERFPRRPAKDVTVGARKSKHKFTPDEDVDEDQPPRYDDEDAEEKLRHDDEDDQMEEDDDLFLDEEDVEEDEDKDENSDEENEDEENEEVEYGDPVAVWKGKEKEARRQLSEKGKDAEPQRTKKHPKNTNYPRPNHY